MTAELTSVTDALEALTDIEVRALKTAASEAPAVANGLLVWLEGACVSEINRCFARDYDLLPPQAATDLSEADASIKAVHAMRESFASSDFAPVALKFFDVLAALLKRRATNGHRRSTPG